MTYRSIIWSAVLLCLTLAGQAQEHVAPLRYQAQLARSLPAPPAKITALSLPFFEDFLGETMYPDPGRWVDRSVYVNNTMAMDPVSRGVATFDALNAKGGPYDSVNSFALLYADSLTSQPIDLSVHTPADSIYLSFFYQPQGRGFAPEAPDSLMLYFRRSNNSWVRVWAREGTPNHPFRQAMIAVTDTAWFHSGFQFRFVNKASINLNDDVWNLDYIRMGVGRNISDTALSDITTTAQPANLLQDYTAMPYRQFAANPGAEQASQHRFTARNLYDSPRNIQYGYNARELITNTPLSGSGAANASLPAYTPQDFQFPSYNISFTPAGTYSPVVIEQTYFASDPTSSDPAENDTIRHFQVFDNYLAYDDGTAEKSYFLHQGNTLPAKTAIEFHLNQPDTLRGVAIYFGRQVPMAFSKFFSVSVYQQIAINNAQDTVLYQQDLYTPGYVDTVNKFWVYKFDTPVPVRAGTFFLGTIQPAQSGSDSLYFGLDANRLGGNHLYVDYQGYWQSSSVQGALMIRPLLGGPVVGTGIGKDKEAGISWQVYPNPATDAFSISTSPRQAFGYAILDTYGRRVKEGRGNGTVNIDISGLVSGIYFVQINEGKRTTAPRKIIKL